MTEAQLEKAMALKNKIDKVRERIKKAKDVVYIRGFDEKGEEKQALVASNIDDETADTGKAMKKTMVDHLQAKLKGFEDEFAAL